ncbi:uncharacterized protein [Spinacia oleracea]|uniref:Uncharacterized protein LOC110778639 isoform X1 n=1 Tax=Spinacia oleracea TaxID=3562 RepID=A0A9R0JLM4_SPIOL|nr:uncharacterized protein LOC110778639 [Spinacia oleracea]XP_021838883.1 uncharacterized protein LOC110778639 [Spinacia oleracea]XP_021838884.1 uncharacterized protein LOC110778639 [Spinacia oleracea]
MILPVCCFTYGKGSGNQYKCLVDCVKTIVREEGGPALLKVFTNFLLIVMMHATWPYEEFQSRRILCCNLELLKFEPIKLRTMMILLMVEGLRFSHFCPSLHMGSV